MLWRYTFVAILFLVQKIHAVEVHHPLAFFRKRVFVIAEFAGNCTSSNYFLSQRDEFKALLHWNGN